MTGPDTAGTTITYTAGTYPKSLSALASNVLSVVAGPTNYVDQTAALNMPPGTYTFTVTGTTSGGDTLATTITWTLTDPCVQTLNMPVFPTATFEYTINDSEQSNNVLPTVTAAPGISTAGQSLSDFCGLNYVLTTSDAKVDACLKDVDSPTSFQFDIACD